LANHVRTNRLNVDSQLRLGRFALVVIVWSVVACSLSDNFLAIADDDWNRLFLSVTVDLHTDGSPDWAVCNDVQQCRTAGYLGIINVRDDVACANTGLRRRAARHDILDDHTTIGFQAEGTAKRRILRRIGTVLDPNTAPGDLSTLNKLVVHLYGGIRRQCES